MSTSTSNYTQGHDTSTLKFHSARSASKHAAHILPHLKPNHKVLDVGCGPGSITRDLALLLPTGHITGLDFSQETIDAAQTQVVKDEVMNVSFVQGSAYELPFNEGVFDVVFCHQVLVHLEQPVMAMKEMRRVCKVGGVVCAREADFGAFIVHPPRQYGIDFVAAAIRAGGGEPNAGRYLVAWALAAGFQRAEVTIGGSIEILSTPVERKFVGLTWAERMAGQSGDKMVTRGICTEEERQECIRARQAFASAETRDGYWGMLSNEAVCIKT